MKDCIIYMYCTLLILFIMEHTCALQIGISVKSVHVRIVSIISNLCYCLNHAKFVLLRYMFNRSLNNVYMIPTYSYSFHNFPSILNSNIYCYSYCYCYYSDFHYYYCDNVQKTLLLYLPYVPIMSNYYILYNPIQQTIIILTFHTRVTLVCVQSVYLYMYLYVTDTDIMSRTSLTYNKTERVFILFLQFLININFGNIYCDFNNNFHLDTYFPLSNRRTSILLFIIINFMRHLCIQACTKSNHLIAINIGKCFNSHVYGSIYLSTFIFTYVYCIIMLVSIPCIFYKRSSATMHYLKILYNTCLTTYHLIFLNVRFCKKNIIFFTKY